MSDPVMDIAIIDDEEVIRESLRGFLVHQGHRIREFTTGATAVAEFMRNPPDLALLDIRMPGDDGLTVLRHLRDQHPELPVIMMSGHGTMDTAISALRLGAADFLRKPVKFADLTAAMERTRRLMAIEGDRHRLRAALSRRQDHADCGFMGTSPACAEAQRFLTAAARAAFDSVLITGETGSGKEVMARDLHRRLRGAEAPFVAVNCPALPETLVESELFGHRKGSFTGAESDQAGPFVLADGGTLFFDEIGDLALAAQAKLLRALETRQVRPLGGHKEVAVAVAVTVIAATNQDLAAMVRKGTFRQDLLYRLNTYQLTLPALRQRREDIPLLAKHLLRGFAVQRRLPQAAFEPAALEALSAYDFPGNVRELRNLIERAMMLSEDGVISAELLGLPHLDVSPTVTLTHSAAAGLAPDAEGAETLAVLTQHRWNRRTAARELRISYDALRWRIDKHGLMQ